MIRRLFDTIVLPTVSYGCEVWALDYALELETKAMQNGKISFFRRLCQFRKSDSPPIILREFTEGPWLHTWCTWWLGVLGFMHRLSEMP